MFIISAVGGFTLIESVTLLAFNLKSTSALYSSSSCIPAITINTMDSHKQSRHVGCISASMMTTTHRHFHSAHCAYRVGRYAALILLSLATPTATHAASQADVATLRAAAQVFLQRQDIAGTKMQIQVSQLDTRLHLTSCAQPLVAEWSPGSRKIGAVMVTVRCPSTEGWSVIVPATIRINQEVLTAAHPLAAGKILESSDVEMRSVDTTNFGSQLLTQPKDAIGKRLTRATSRGEPLRLQVLATPILVRRGSEVILRAHLGDLEVQASGKALADGAEGQRVRVQNVKSLRIVEGWVLADGSVKVSM